jgi:signal transduction histidine kinase
MKKAETTRHLRKSLGDPRSQVFFLYCKSLEQYLAGGGESALRGAYEAGRLGLANDLGVLDMAALHHSALVKILIRARGQDETQANLSAASQFFAESLSRYEMAYRGYRDAMAALHLLNETLEKEANRIARAVHDQAGHLLLAVHLAMAEIARDLPPALQGKIKDVIDLLHQAEGQLRELSHELHPTMLHDLGLVPAVRLLADGVSKRSSLSIWVEATLDGRLPTTVETALYRIIQEALTNVTKHAQAENVWIKLDGDAPRICCSIRDDGVGFDVRAPRGQKGLGLIGIQERLSAIGGTLQITSEPGKGTLLLVTVPRKRAGVNPRNARR